MLRAMVGAMLYAIRAIVGAMLYYKEYKGDSWYDAILEAIVGVMIC